LRRDLDAIQHASERATAITAQLLAFSRRQVLHPRVLGLGEVLGDMEKLVRRLVGEHIELRWDVDPDTPPIKADPVQIEQVLINLVLNARDALPEGGNISIETTNVTLEAGRSASYDNVAPGSYALLSVSDDGLGMDAATQSHIFEPFFTTKEEGKGTGLGLSTVYGIVKQTGGFIEVKSQVGEGSTLKIYFPAAAEEPAATGEAKPATTAPQSRGFETILLVEDEEMVRVLATRVLSSHGYLVLEAENGEEALEICRRHEGPIGLLITDVVMPGMNGRELADRLTAMNPDAAVLFVSGYTGGALVEHGALRDGTNFLQKPFSPQHLVERVREVLDGA
jgi:CheY-like chemotaxis protein